MSRKRINLTVDDDQYELVARISEQTGLSAAAIVETMFNAHLADLHEYADWMDQLPEGNNPLRERGAYLLHSFGPGTLVDDIKQVDPTYRTFTDRFIAGEYMRPNKNKNKNNKDEE